MSGGFLRDDHLEFALHLHRRLAEAVPDGEVIWSPYSVACALGVLAAGARATTRTELTTLLGTDPAPLLAALDRAVADSPDLASRTVLWVSADVPVHSSFRATVHDRPDSDVRTADFRTNPEGVRATVNADIADATRGMIRELLPQGAVTPDLRAILTNALWARARWTTPFEAHLTREGTFRTPRGPKRVPFMHRTGTMPYATARGWGMVTLHAHDELAVDVLLPPGTNAAAVPTAPLLTALHRRSASTSVELALPRFELTQPHRLVEVLAEAGVRTLFTASADLSGISTVPLYVDTVIHQARLRVDERGAEGAAATAAMMLLAGAMPPRRTIRFSVDRPFHIVVRRRGAILFLGSIADPHDPGPAQ
ncbi:MAG: serpin family protein [Thermobifida fusca]